MTKKNAEKSAARARQAMHGGRYAHHLRTVRGDEPLVARLNRERLNLYREQSDAIVLMRDKLIDSIADALGQSEWTARGKAALARRRQIVADHIRELERTRAEIRYPAALAEADEACEEAIRQLMAAHRERHQLFLRASDAREKQANAEHARMMARIRQLQ